MTTCIPSSDETCVSFVTHTVVNDLYLAIYQSIYYWTQKKTLPLSNVLGGVKKINTPFSTFYFIYVFIFITLMEVYFKLSLLLGGGQSMHLYASDNGIAIMSKAFQENWSKKQFNNCFPNYFLRTLSKNQEHKREDMPKIWSLALHAWITSCFYVAVISVMHCSNTTQFFIVHPNLNSIYCLSKMCPSIANHVAHHNCLEMTAKSLQMHSLSPNHSHLTAFIWYIIV